MTRRGGGKDARRGGGNILLPVGTGPEFNIPQRDIDQAIVQTARASIDAAYRAEFAAGHVEKGRAMALIRRIVIDCGRMLAATPFKTLTPKQRAFLIKWCPKGEQARFLVPGTPPIPEVLKNLPKKPPTRRVTDEDE